ncbi:hypothetical protein SAY86_014688 [Trapa natans]|uniref:Uncharacterized protein n=1 Tax=Trapa natans TaxID=22666 RepID=A0AAN7QG72_TRANT|nr:hypothetical protein SAY86_014688 [Trapa natans]
MKNFRQFNAVNHPEQANLNSRPTNPEHLLAESCEHCEEQKNPEREASGRTFMCVSVILSEIRLAEPGYS